MIDICKKIVFLLLTKYQKIYRFLSVCIQNLQKLLIYDLKNVFSPNFCGVSKKAEFYAASKFLEIGSTNLPKKTKEKSAKSKKLKNHSAFCL
jgi:hypothetical protein